MCQGVYIQKRTIVLAHNRKNYMYTSIERNINWSSAKVKNWNILKHVNTGKFGHPTNIKAVIDSTLDEYVSSGDHAKTE